MTPCIEFVCGYFSCGRLLCKLGRLNCRLLKLTTFEAVKVSVGLHKPSHFIIVKKKKTISKA